VYPPCFNNAGSVWGPGNYALFDAYMESNRSDDFQGGFGNLSIVPDVEYCSQLASGAGDEPLPNCTRFPVLDGYRVNSSDKALRGFQDHGGTIWVDTRDTINFKYVSSEDNNIVLLVSVAGWTAYNKVTKKRVPSGRAHIRWKNFASGAIPMTGDNSGDPWQVEPFITINNQGRTVMRFDGKDWVIDYRTDKDYPNIGQGRSQGWENFKGVSGSRNWSAHLRSKWGGDGNDPSIYNVPGGAGYFCDQEGSAYWENQFPGGPIELGRGPGYRVGNSPQYGDKTVPMIHYGLENPFAGQHGGFNALPYDFAAPLVLQSFLNKPYRDLIFSGDT